MDDEKLIFFYNYGLDFEDEDEDEDEFEYEKINDNIIEKDNKTKKNELKSLVSSCIFPSYWICILFIGIPIVFLYFRNLSISFMKNGNLVPNVNYYNTNKKISCYYSNYLFSESFVNIKIGIDSNLNEELYGDIEFKHEGETIYLHFDSKKKKKNNYKNKYLFYKKLKIENDLILIANSTISFGIQDLLQKSLTFTVSEDNNSVMMTNQKILGKINLKYNFEIADYFYKDIILNLSPSIYFLFLNMSFCLGCFIFLKKIIQNEDKFAESKNLSLDEFLKIFNGIYYERLRYDFNVVVIILLLTLFNHCKDFYISLFGTFISLSYYIIYVIRQLKIFCLLYVFPIIGIYGLIKIKYLYMCIKDAEENKLLVSYNEYLDIYKNFYSFYMMDKFNLILFRVNMSLALIMLLYTVYHCRCSIKIFKRLSNKQRNYNDVASIV